MPEYGKALNRIRSGVDAPLRDDADPFAWLVAGGERVFWGWLWEAEMVVERWRLVVSVLGGGGNEERRGVEESTEARHRKHSPVP